MLKSGQTGRKWGVKLNILFWVYTRIRDSQIKCLSFCKVVYFVLVLVLSELKKKKDSKYLSHYNNVKPERHNQFLMKVSGYLSPVQTDSPTTHSTETKEPVC